ncbi:MAG: efflux RND transporter periplasmic adaptor subunit [Acidobacteriota bacterium]
MNITLKRALFPLVGIALTALVVVQSRDLGASSTSSTPRTLNAPNTAPHVTAEGRLVTYPGAQVVVGTDIRGTLINVAVEEKQLVKKGQLLAELRADDLRASRAEAAARVGESAADIKLYEIEVARAARLVVQRVETQANADRAERNRDAAYAHKRTAEAEVRRIDAELAKTRILSPIDGVVLVKHVHTGETIDAGDPVIDVADLRRVRVEAEVDEFDVGRVSLGAPVVVRAEGFDGQSWAGRVEEIPDAVTGRRLKPQDPGKPQDTRVLLVKVALDEATPLKLGQRVEVEVGAH